MEFLNVIFKLLNTNSEFPKYQLERRVDIFINVFLEDLLTSYFNDGCKVQYICPEFPFKKDGNRQSTNVDYLCSRELGGNKEIIFVELKTEKRSFDASQLEIYMKNKDWKILNDNITELGKSKKYKGKYETLINRINEQHFPTQTKIRILYISPIQVISKIAAKGNSVDESKIKSLAELLLLTKSFPSEAALFAKFVNDWDLGVFEIKS